MAKLKVDETDTMDQEDPYQEESIVWTKRFSHISYCSCGGVLFHYDTEAWDLSQVNRKELREAVLSGESWEDCMEAFEINSDEWWEERCEKCGRKNDFPKRGGA